MLAARSELCTIRQKLLWKCHKVGHCSSALKVAKICQESDLSAYTNGSHSCLALHPSYILINQQNTTDNKWVDQKTLKACRMPCLNSLLDKYCSSKNTEHCSQAAIRSKGYWD